MAKTQKIDPAAAKARKQKIVLGVIGAVLLLIAVIQGPKLMKQLSGGSSVPAAAAPADTTATTGTGAPAATATATVPALAGASLPVGNAADPTQGKLISFSLFATKDPFVPQVSDKPATDAAAPVGTGATAPAAAGTDATAPAAAGTGTPPAGQATAPAGNGTAAAAPDQPPLTDATLVINGTAEYLKPRGTFPASDPVFELRVIKPKTVKIGVAGGAFTDGKLLVLKMDKGITLVNTATGARYKITLVYTGAAPETVESFTAGSPAGDASGQAATSSSTVDASAASK
jgi:hypothetical protein